MVDILSLEIKSKYGTTGTNKLTGSIGSRVTAEIEFMIHLEVIDVDLSFGDGTNVIYSNDGTDFVTAGFIVGMIIQVVTESGNNDGTYQILGVTNGAIFVANVGSGSGSGGVAFTEELSVVGSIHDVTPVTAIDYYYGLVKNGDGPAYNSLFDGETQHYRKTGLDASQSNTYQLDVFTTNKSWVTGSTSEQALTTIEETGIGTSGASYGYEQCFRISHTFHITPAIMRAWEDANEELDITLIAWLNQNASVYFIPKIVAGWEASGSEHSTDNGNINSVIQPGDVGFYGEYRNGGAAKYVYDTAIAFQSSTSNSITVLSYNDTTACNITLRRVAGNFTASDAKIDLYVWVVPDDEDAQNNTSTFWQNYDVSNVELTDGSTGVSDNRITNAEANVTGDEIEINFNFVPVAAHAGKKFFIYVDIGEESSDEATNDHHTIDLAYGTFAKYIDTTGLMEVYDGLLINEHSSNDLSKANTDFKGWIEDGLLATMYFDVKKLTGVSDQYSALISSVVLTIDAEHQTDSTRNFNLETITIPLPSNTTQGFQLYTGDPKNYKNLNELTGNATFRKYLLECATKIRWEQWVLLTNADPDFANASANWSEYDLPPDWKIYANAVITVNLINVDDDNDTETFVRTQKANIRLKNYEEYIGCTKTGLIQTYHAVTGQNLNGKLSPNANTLVKATFYGESLFPCIYQNITSGSGECEFNPLSSGSGSFASGDGDIALCPDYYGILEIYKPNSGNTQNIRQISTIWDTETGSPWIGAVSVNKASLVAYPYASPPRIEVYATVDYTQLTTSSAYYISGRLGRGAQTICDASIMARVFDESTYSNAAITGFTTDELLIFYNDDEITVMSMVASIVGDTITFTVPLSGNIKIVCCRDTIVDSVDPANDYYENPALVGLTLDDFLFFHGDDGTELTSKTGTSFNSGLGQINPVVASSAIKISFHSSLINTSMSSSTTYSNNLLIGLGETDVMIFVEGIEYTHKGATISGNTITFPSAVSGIIKVVKVNQ